MPEALQNITVGEILAWAAGLGAIGVVVYKIWGPIRALQTFLRDWSGKPARKDRAGRTIEDAEPGVLGRLDTMRADMDRVLHQVENDHSTNFRNDLDVVRQNVEVVSHKLDEHIVISKDHDRHQEETASRLEDHLESTQKWTAMLTELHDQYHRRPPDPPQKPNDTDEPR